MAPVVPTVVAGIMLQYMDLEHALGVLGMDRAELEAVMAASPAWPLPGQLDGWKLSHDAIRRDMDAMVAAIDKTKELVEGGQALQRWQVAALQLIAADFYHNVHQHHHHEECIFFPWLATRVPLPPKLSSDHAALMSLLDRMRELCSGLPTTDNSSSSLEQLSRTLAQLRPLMRQHLEEEEILGLPLMRKHFTAKEAAVPEKKIIAELKPSDMAWFLRPMPEVADKRQTMTRLGIPGFVQWLVMMPAVRRDERTVLRAFAELTAGEQAQQPAKKRTAPWQLWRAA